MGERQGPDHEVPRDLADIYVAVFERLGTELGRTPTGLEVDAEIARARAGGLL